MQREAAIRREEALRKAAKELKKIQRRAVTPKTTPPKAPEAENSKLNAAKLLYDAVYSIGIYKDNQDKHSEVSKNTNKIKELLINPKVNLNIQTHDYTALYTAVEYGLTDIVKLLIQSGANVNLPNQTGNSTPLHVAVANADQAMVKLLLNNNADPNIKNNTKLTALDLAKLYNFKDIEQLLLSRQTSTPQQPNSSNSRRFH